MAVAREAKMILASVERNNNKFWHAKLLANNTVQVTFGRVGTNGAVQNKAFTSQQEALRYFESKIKEKEKGGYMQAKVFTGGELESNSATKPLFKDTLSKLAAEQMFPEGGEDALQKAEQDARAAILSSSDPDDPPAHLLHGEKPAVSSSDTTTITSSGHRRHDSKDLVTTLVKHLVEANTHKIMTGTTLSYDQQAGLFRTPLGVVTQDAVDEARLLLAKLGDIVAASSTSGSGSSPAVITTNTSGVVVATDLSEKAWAPLLERYLMLIPRDIGRYKPSLRSLFPDLAAIRNDSSVLDALESSIKSVQDSIRAKAGAAQQQQASGARIFHAQLAPVRDEGLFAYVKHKFVTGINSHHSYTTRSLRLHRLYTCSIKTMDEAFRDQGKAVGNIKRLWHGTRPSNVLSILSSGMQVPPSTSSHVTGRLYGDGLYFATQSTKSLQYSIGHAPGQSRSSSNGSDGRSSAFMFLCQVALGNPFIPDGRSSRHSYPPPVEFGSTWAKGGLSPGVLNDEIIVYKTAQASTLFLCEFR
jgi:poly [ADP-ribose] polymerase 2/3/4